QDRDRFVEKLQRELGDHRILLWVVVRCQTSDTFFEPWRNPKFRGRILYPCCGGWRNEPTRLVYSVFTGTEDAREETVAEAEAGGPSRLRELVGRDFGIPDIPIPSWAEGGPRGRLGPWLLDQVDWGEIYEELLFPSTDSRPASAVAAV